MIPDFPGESRILSGEISCIIVVSVVECTYSETEQRCLKAVDEPLSKRFPPDPIGRASFGLGSFLFAETRLMEESKMKKTLALILTVVLVLSLAAGCAGKSEAPAAAEAPAAEAPAEPAAEAPAEPAAEAPAEEPAAETAVNTVILKEADDKMINTYTVLAVNPEAPFADADGNPVSDVAVNTAGAEALIDWLLSEEGKKLAAEYGKTIHLSTTTSVNDSGLLGALLPVFESEYGYKVEIQSAGTGKAIAAAKYGNADLILVHAKAQEETFVADGFARVLPGFESERLSFLYNFFVLCGPADDPAGVKGYDSVLDAFAAIAEGKYPFISRGDGSGTHTKELSLWPEALGITAEAESFADYTDWYISANAGMGSCLVMAEQMHAYILTDKATFLTFPANGGVM